MTINIRDMTKHNDWIEQLRDKMDGFEEPTPEGLWQDIETALSQDAQQPRRALIIPVRKWAAAAAVAAILIGGGTWFGYNNISQSNNLTETSEQAGSETDLAASELLAQPQNHQEDFLAVRQASSASIMPTTLKPTTTKLHATSSTQVTAPPSPVPTELRVDTPQNDSHAPKAKPSHESETSSVAHRANPQPSKTEKEILRALEEADNSSQRKSIRYGVNLYAANDLIGISNSSTVVNYTMAPGYYGFDAENETVKTPVRNYNESSKHYQPYSIGLTGRIGLTDKWSLSTGLVYTRLHSDFTSTMGSAVIKQKQTLHEIGIPLNVMYRVWGNRHLVTYAVAGGQADFNFKATLETDGVSQDMDKDRVQWSVNAGIGAQYNFIPSLGVYLEPGVKYYFDNGSPLENTFKDKPCNFNIQFGIRYNIGE